ncbi:Zn(2)-Cys(6) binuclear cluster domain-containing protein [Armillaria luteobubalina]|uniref:Zn(2)-Cys(6) binuclear cluster domain-containing protein n=1 Tax=Armillaria luteobubalina TaxID=153913 RepID=A0AA39PZP7_9AGAR|nr:Zn(2)-Cys(6) binuclear cluster domain-containing protein [Armillaria luteobubalina]
MSSPSSTRNSVPLHWGQACIHCRRRKMRCDGARPICGQCTRGNRSEDCQYRDSQGRTKMEVLEENIIRVEARIRELESPQEQGLPVLLSNPYSVDGSSSNAESVPPLVYGWWTLPEPPLELKSVLIDRFLDCASEYGFFMNVSRFRSAALDPSAYYYRPLPALMTTIYLLGIFLSHTPSLTLHEKTFLERALTDVSGALTNHHPQKVLQTIQAEVLLASYFLASGRFLEGKYHITTALSLGLSIGLNRIRSDRNTSSGPVTILPAPQDAIEEGERVDACWVVFILDKCWAVALASEPCSTCPSDLVGIQIDTPWPLEVQDYERVHPTSNSYTVQKYLKGTPTSGGDEMSAKALHAKASLLWERATDLIRNWKSDMTQEESIDFYASFAALDGLLENLRSALPSPNELANSTSSKRNTLFVAHNLTYATIIQLYGLFARIDPQSQDKVLMAAQAVFRMTGSVSHGSPINPIIGTIWVSAGQVLLEELVVLRASRLGHSPASARETELMSVLNARIQDMCLLAESCILLKYQVMQIQEVFAAL